MNVLGLNKGSTLHGKSLRHGGAAALVDGNIFAISEERIVGRKYEGGYTNALARVLEVTGLRVDEFDRIGISSCCELETMSGRGHDLEGHARSTTINHHLSHAALAFYASPFDQALVVVIDGGGNVLHTDENEFQPDRWWSHPREQHSYYVASRTRGLELIDRDFVAPFEVGMGEAFRAFTYYLGWPSSTNSSRTMALAGHGRRGAIEGELFSFDDGHLHCLMRNDPADPIGMVTELSRTMDVDFGEPRSQGDEFLQIHRDVAAFIQGQVEHALQMKLSYLKRKTGADKLCIGGGFALNVVANGKMLDLFPDGVYVPSAPGDDGQPLGNSYALIAQNEKGTKTMPVISKSSDAFLGPASQINAQAVASALAGPRFKRYVVFETTNFSELVAQMLAGGSIVCVYSKSAEFGPRALGARSILADPRRADVVSRLNTLKSREWFMPFAPSVLEERMHDWFEPSARSPFMSFAITAKPKAKATIPAILNADGTARVQTLAPDDENPLRAILERFAERTDVPVLLNTSYNLGGAPIVETVDQAVDAFSKMPVNALAMGRFVILKSLSPHIADLPISSTVRNLTLEVFDHREGRGTPVLIPESKPGPMIRRLQALTDSVVFVRTELPLYGEYLNWLREGRKVTTIRFRKGAVEIPFNSTLPLYETADFSAGNRSTPTEHVKVSALRYRRFGELSAADASRDGFESAEHMHGALTTIYPEIAAEDWVTVYDIGLVDRDGEEQQASAIDV